MPHIPIMYGAHGEPFVTGHVYVRGHVLAPRVLFVVDTAADSSLITPADEAVLAAVNSTILRDEMFTRGVKSIRTILGHAKVKCIHGANTGIALPDVNHAPVSIDIPFLYFADEKQRTVPWWLRKLANLDDIWDLPGEHSMHSILGRDVLRNFALVSVPDQRYGFLTSDKASLRKILAGKDFQSVDHFYNAPDDPWR